jgi:hypothetical protein
LSGSDDVFTHVPLQSVWPAVHAQEPPEQRVPPEQAVPHVPQFLESVWVSAHVAVAEQKVGVELGHAQLPPLHASAPGQATPQVPQFAGSVSVSVQVCVPEQNVLPPEQPQLPPLHPCAAAQARPQAPQLSGSVPVSVQWPPHSTVPEPQPQVPSWHAPP